MSGEPGAARSAQRGHAVTSLLCSRLRNPQVPHKAFGWPLRNRWERKNWGGTVKHGGETGRGGGEWGERGGRGGKGEEWGIVGGARKMWCNKKKTGGKRREMEGKCTESSKYPCLYRSDFSHFDGGSDRKLALPTTTALSKTWHPNIRREKMGNPHGIRRCPKTGVHRKLAVGIVQHAHAVHRVPWAVSSSQQCAGRRTRRWQSAPFHTCHRCPVESVADDVIHGFAVNATVGHTLPWDLRAAAKIQDQRFWPRCCVISWVAGPPGDAGGVKTGHGAHSPRHRVPEHEHSIRSKWDRQQQMHRTPPCTMRLRA